MYIKRIRRHLKVLRLPPTPRMTIEFLRHAPKLNLVGFRLGGVMNRRGAEGRKKRFHPKIFPVMAMSVLIKALERIFQHLQQHKPEI